MSRSHSLHPAAVALIITALLGSAAAEQYPAPDQAPQVTPDAAEDGSDHSAWQEWRGYMHQWMMGDDDEDGRGSRQMSWREDCGSGMMRGSGMPMRPGMMPMIMVAMMDTDGSGSISFEEVTAIHRRMFNLMDQDKNGELSAEEMRALMGDESAAQ